MRFLTALGALVFGYLTITPVSLIGAQLDSACAGEGCESSIVIRGLLLVAYLACAVTLFGTAALMVDHTLRGTHASQERIVRGLLACGIAVGVTAFSLLALAEPRGAAFVLGVAGVCYGALRYLNRERPPVDSSSNGHRPEPPELNGHRP